MQQLRPRRKKYFRSGFHSSAAIRKCIQAEEFAAPGIPKK
jgi:hypothetical protein